MVNVWGPGLESTEFHSVSHIWYFFSGFTVLFELISHIRYYFIKRLWCSK
jgi:hypothetical protein